jgi:hypothetical protein
MLNTDVAGQKKVKYPLYPCFIFNHFFQFFSSSFSLSPTPLISLSPLFFFLGIEFANQLN